MGESNIVKCEACGKTATFKDPVHVVAASDDASDYRLICGTCIAEPEKWVPSDWSRVVDNVGRVWWEADCIMDVAVTVQEVRDAMRAGIMRLHKTGGGLGCIINAELPLLSASLDNADHQALMAAAFQLGQFLTPQQRTAAIAGKLV